MKWEARREHREIGIRPARKGDSGYQRPVEHLCHKRDEPERKPYKPSPRILAAIAKMEAFYGVEKAVPVEALAPDEDGNPLPLRETDSGDL